MDNIINLWIFITLMVGTPGPANLLLMSAGSRFGWSANISFIAGLVMGKLCLNTAMAFGLGSLLLSWPTLATVTKFISAAYIIYLALRSWNQSSRTPVEQRALGFINGLWVHPLSPKTWVMSTIAFTQFGPGLGAPPQQWLIIAGSFLLIQIAGHNIWCFAGALLDRALGHVMWLQNALVILTIAVTLWAVSL
ncbi:MAG: LysE family transporter [Gammaproteobacteria bacterium]|jgi:threonine/homoserine/homoserine lactone efflux protein|nr:LysE family transporter [Gammaproteobacteria bacterium]MCP4881240.1 LysE family transporter [Gammaproteobacteria bacterium]MDP6164934.1 LysE family transporter [Gammaproteobacteria bacterium]